MAFDFNFFLATEKASRDTIDLKKIYIDMAGSLLAGVLLSQIIYWHLPDNNGKSRLTILRDDHLWLAKKREDWWEECRITANEYDWAVTNLVKKGLVVKRVFKFEGNTVGHLRIDESGFMKSYLSFLTQAPKNCSKKDSAILQNPNREFDKTRNPIYKDTETTCREKKSYQTSGEVASAPKIKEIFQKKVIYHPFLSDEEKTGKRGRVEVDIDRWNDLCTKYSEHVVTMMAHDLSGYMFNTGKTYKSHEITLLNFIKKHLKDQPNTRDFERNKKVNWVNPEGAGTHKFRPEMLQGD